MGKIEKIIRALESLPPHQREEVEDMVLELAESLSGRPGSSSLTADQLAEVRQRRTGGFQAGDQNRINEIIARLR